MLTVVVSLSMSIPEGVFATTTLASRAMHWRAAPSAATFLALSVVLAPTLASDASAAVVFDNITSATFSTTSFFRVGEYDAFPGDPLPHSYTVSTRITLAGDGMWRLTALGARMSRDADFLGAGRARAWISEAVEGAGPSQTYEVGTLSTTATVPTNVAIDGLASQGITLLGGHSYWVTLGAVPGDLDATRVRWYRSSIGTAGSTLIDDLLDNSSWMTGDGLTPGIKLTGEVIPAPSVVALLAIAGLARRRTR